MANRTNTGTADLPLKFAKELTAIVNREWENGNMLTKVTPVTADLLNGGSKKALQPNATEIFIKGNGRRY